MREVFIAIPKEGLIVPGIGIGARAVACGYQGMQIDSAWDKEKGTGSQQNGSIVGLVPAADGERLVRPACLGRDVSDYSAPNISELCFARRYGPPRRKLLVSFGHSASFWRRGDTVVSRGGFLQVLHWRIHIPNRG